MYLKLPEKNRNEIAHIKDFDFFIGENIIQIYILKEKIIEDYNRYIKGELSFNNNFYLLLNIFSRIFNLEIRLKIIYELEFIYNNIIEGLLIHYPIDGLKKENNLKMFNKETKTISIEFEWYVFSFAIKSGDLKNILDKYFKQNYILKLNNNKDIDKINKNICKEFTISGFTTTKYSQLFDNLLVISSWVNLTQENFDLIIDSFNDKLKNNLLGVSRYQNVEYFLSIQYHKNKNLDFANIATIIKNYINAFLSGKLGNNTLVLRYSSMFYNVFKILINKKIKLEDGFNPKISEFIANLKNKNINDKY